MAEILHPVELYLAIANHILDCRLAIQTLMSEGTIEPRHIPSTEQPADCLTKALPLPLVKLTREGLGLVQD